MAATAECFRVVFWPMWEIAQLVPKALEDFGYVIVNSKVLSRCLVLQATTLSSICNRKLKRFSTSVILRSLPSTQMLHVCADQMLHAHNGNSITDICSPHLNICSFIIIRLMQDARHRFCSNVICSSSVSKSVCLTSSSIALRVPDTGVLYHHFT